MSRAASGQGRAAMLAPLAVALIWGFNVPVMKAGLAGLERLPVPQAVDAHDGCGRTVEAAAAGLGQLNVAQGALEVGLGGGVIQGITLEPQRLDRFRHRFGLWFRFGHRLGFRLGCDGLLELAVRRRRRELVAGPEAAGDHDKFLGLFVFWIFDLGIFRGILGVVIIRIVWIVRLLLRQAHLSAKGIHGAFLRFCGFRCQQHQCQQYESTAGQQGQGAQPREEGSHRSVNRRLSKNSVKLQQRR